MPGLLRWIMVTSTFPFTEILLKADIFKIASGSFSVAETLVVNRADDRTIAVNEVAIRVLIEVFIIFLFNN